MKVVVFGASGKVGQKVVAKLLASDHIVVAFVYGGSSFSENKNLEVVQGDVKDLDSVGKVVVSCDAVISTLGSWGTKTKDILSAGMANIVPVMEAQGVKRIISLTGADALLPGEKAQGIQLLTRPIFSLLAGKILRDSEDHLKTLEASSLDWTVVRSPVMNEKGSKSFLLNTERPKPWETIHRDAIATSILSVLEDDIYIKQAPIIHRS
jgi:putative NADH-flavin reductase